MTRTFALRTSSSDCGSVPFSLEHFDRMLVSQLRSSTLRESWERNEKASANRLDKLSCPPLLSQSENEESGGRYSYIAQEYKLSQDFRSENVIRRLLNLRTLRGR